MGLGALFAGLLEVFVFASAGDVQVKEPDGVGRRFGRLLLGDAQAGEGELELLFLLGLDL